MLNIERYDSGLLESSMYVITENGHAVIIDPARNTAPGEGLTVNLLIITHEHYDHISGVNLWKEKYQAPLLSSAACSGRITDPRKNQARHFDVLMEIQKRRVLDRLPDIDNAYTCMADRTFEEELEFDWQGHHFRLRALPGHSPGSIGIWLDETRFFSGDSLLEHDRTELRFPGGSRKVWEEVSRPVLESLPSGTVIYPGHYDSYILK